MSPPPVSRTPLPPCSQEGPALPPAGITAPQLLPKRGVHTVVAWTVGASLSGWVERGGSGELSRERDGVSQGAWSGD